MTFVHRLYLRFIWIQLKIENPKAKEAQLILLTTKGRQFQFTTKESQDYARRFALLHAIYAMIYSRMKDLMLQEFTAIELENKLKELVNWSPVVLFQIYGAIGKVLATKNQATKVFLPFVGDLEPGEWVTSWVESEIGEIVKLAKGESVIVSNTMFEWLMIALMKVFEKFSETETNELRDTSNEMGEAIMEQEQTTKPAVSFDSKLLISAFSSLAVCMEQFGGDLNVATMATELHTITSAAGAALTLDQLLTSIKETHGNNARDATIGSLLLAAAAACFAIKVEPRHAAAIVWPSRRLFATATEDTPQQQVPSAWNAACNCIPSLIGVCAAPGFGTAAYALFMVASAAVTWHLNSAPNTPSALSNPAEERLTLANGACKLLKRKRESGGGNEGKPTTKRPRRGAAGDVASLLDMADGDE